MTDRHTHVEAFCLMKYVDTGGNVEFIWNSRDGVTPFCVTSRHGLEARHVNWQSDQYAPNHCPRSGDRIFRDLTVEEAKVAARRRLEACSNLALEMFGTIENGIERLWPDIYADGRQPILVEVP